MRISRSAGPLLRALVAAALWGCDSGREARSGQPPPATVADFQTLRWLGGTWRGSEGGRNPFYERYQLQTDTLIRILYLADSMGSRASDSGSVYLRAGTVYHEAAAACGARCASTARASNSSRPSA